MTEAAVQDFSIETSTEDSYGGFFQDYTLNLIVMPDGMMTDKSVWLVNMTIPAGSNEAIVPAEGAKVMEPTSAEDEMGKTWTVIWKTTARRKARNNS